MASSASGTRRLLSLCFLLGLVIVLMQKVADPQHVRRAFSALGVPLDEPETYSSALGEIGANDQPGDKPSFPPVSHSGEALSSDGNEDLSTEQRWRRVCRDLIGRLMADASGELINELSLKWFAVARSPGALQGEVIHSTWLGDHIEYEVATELGALFIIDPLMAQRLPLAARVGIHFKPQGLALIAR